MHSPGNEAFLLPQHLLSLNTSGLTDSVGWGHWVVPECLCGHRQKFPGATESKLCHRSRTVLTDFFLAHDVLGKLEGENEC